MSHAECCHLTLRGTAKRTDRQTETVTEQLKSCSQQGVIQDQPLEPVLTNSRCLWKPSYLHLKFFQEAIFFNFNSQVQYIEEFVKERQ